MFQIILVLLYYIFETIMIDVAGLDGNIAILGMLAVGIVFIIGKLDAINNSIKNNKR